jgi:hypothetical protein
MVETEEASRANRWNAVAFGFTHAWRSMLGRVIWKVGGYGASAPSTRNPSISPSLAQKPTRCNTLIRPGTSYCSPLRRCKQTEIENLTGDGGRRCCAEFWCVQLIIYKETKESKPWASVAMQPSENRNTVAVQRPQQAKPRQSQKLQPRTPSILIFHLPPAEVLLSSVARLGALELSQLAGPFQVRGEYPSRVSENRLLNLFKAVGRECQQQGDPVGSPRISGDRDRMCDTRANIRTSFPKTAASRDLLGWVVEAVRIEETANQDLDRGPTRRSAHAWPAWAQEQNPRVH